MDAMQEVGRRVEALDPTLFDGIFSPSSVGDRRSWLAVQRAVRRPSGYIYLEIGSHLGGSLQQHLLDPWCRTIVSIDKRPASQPDDRGRAVVFHYPGNSTARMLDGLRRVAPNALDKIVCRDADARDIDPRTLPGPADICFIDGEHTCAAALSDFEFCLTACAADAAICFHDDWIVADALWEVLARLRRRGLAFTARKLDGATFGVFLEGCPAAQDPFVRDCGCEGRAWLRGKRLKRRVRTLVPAWLEPAARSVARRIGLG